MCVVLARPVGPGASAGTDAWDLRCGGRRNASLVAGCAQSGLVAAVRSQGRETDTGRCINVPCGGGLHNALHLCLHRPRGAVHVEVLEAKVESPLSEITI